MKREELSLLHGTNDENENYCKYIQSWFSSPFQLKTYGLPCRHAWSACWSRIGLLIGGRDGRSRRFEAQNSGVGKSRLDQLLDFVLAADFHIGHEQHVSGLDFLVGRLQAGTEKSSA